MFSIRTKLSLAQFLELQEQEFVALLLDKHDIGGTAVRYTTNVLQDLVSSFQRAADVPLHSLVGEIARTDRDLRSRVNPKYRYDERFGDLKNCLLLDGYILANWELRPLDPSIVEEASVEDDLTLELRASGLSDADEVVKKLQDSVQAFRTSPPNFNACLNDARVALQSLATIIARARQLAHPGLFDVTKWGSVVGYLKSSGFITDEEEKGLVGVFGFVSPGSHRPIGITDQEFARLGRSFVAGMCWFLAKRYRGSP
jgi:hypothetical protein